ncbi:MAG: hypothetical protein KY468_07195 [Armatimonadetes bacterium]|nr:hypothetical protein [Armatimonadota bacterium]
MPESPSPNELLYLGTNDGLRVLCRASDGARWEVAAQALDNAPVTAVQPAPDGSGDLLCAVGVWGMWRCSPDAKATRECNAGIFNRELHALAVAVDGTAVYAGAAPPQVYRSTDGGNAWETLASFERIPGSEGWFYPVPPNYANIRQIVAHPAQPQTLYVGVEVGGLFRSRDGGETWEDLTGDMDPDCHAIALHPERPERIVVSTPRGPFLSCDEGRTWTPLWKDRRPSYSASVAACPAEPDTLVAGISRGFRGGECRIYLSEDGAETWREAEGKTESLFPSQIRGALTYARTTPRTAYAGSLAGDLLESRDGGRTWAVAVRGLPPIRAIYAS